MALKTNDPLCFEEESKLIFLLSIESCLKSDLLCLIGWASTVSLCLLQILMVLVSLTPLF